MNLLSKATDGKRGRAQKVVVYGPEGIGKSMLASNFPDAFFFDVEDSTSQLSVRRLGRDALPDLKTFESALDEVAKNPTFCKTLIVDTVDWLEEMAVAELCAEHKCKNIEEIAGGFGKGYGYLTNRVSVTLARLDQVIAAGINVVLLAHAQISRFDPPDGAGAFDRYELKLYKDRKGGKGTASLIKEWSDMLLFINWRTQISEKGKGDNVKYKGVGGRERVIYCNRTAAWDAKNRHGLADEEKWGKDTSEAIKVIEKAFRSVGAPWGAGQPAKSEPEPVDGNAAQGEPASDLRVSHETAAPAPDPSGDTITMDIELARICQPHADEITAYLRGQRKIALDGTWTDMPADYAARVKKNPARFLQVALNGGNGK